MRALTSAIGAVVLLAGCGGSDAPARFAHTAAPSDLEAVADGSLLVAERSTGRILRVDDGKVDELASVDVVDEPGQRGLLGVLAVDGDVYASWTRESDGRLVVGRVVPSERMVWVGPVSADLANGGRLAMLDGDLLIGIGDLTDPAKVDDPTEPNGKLLRLDPDGPEDQEPVVVSSGWHNPFAFTVLDDGAVWVADNAPGSARERIASGDLTDVVELEGTAAPSGVLADGTDLLVCGYVSRELRRYHRHSAQHTVVADGCRYDVARLADGRIVMADDDGVVIVRRGR